MDLSKLRGLSDYQHLIFQDFDAIDLQNCTKVSKSWQKMISEYVDPGLLAKLCRIQKDMKTQAENAKLYGELKRNMATFINNVNLFDLSDVRCYTEEKLKIIASENNSILQLALTLGRTDLIRRFFNHLEEYGIEVNAPNRIKRTPFMCACLNGHEEAVKHFLANAQAFEIDVNAIDHYGCTPLIYAAMNGHHQVVKLLLQIEDINLKAGDLQCRTVFDWACMNGHEEVVQVLVEFAVQNDFRFSDDNFWVAGYMSQNENIAKMLRENVETIGIANPHVSGFPIFGLDLLSARYVKKSDRWRRYQVKNLPVKPTTLLCLDACCNQGFNPYPNSRAVDRTKNEWPQFIEDQGFDIDLATDSEEDEDF